jgi:hypothetical protein
LAAIRGCILEPVRILLNSQKLDSTSKFTEIHNSHESYDGIQHHHLTRRKSISQGGMQQYQKNSWTRRNAKIHGQRGKQKFIDKEACKNSWTRRNAKIS